MRRRVMLERAAWQLRHGASVTDAAFAAGYESVEGFSRAFQRAYGHPPSQEQRRAARARRALAARAQRHPLPPAHLPVGPHRGERHEPTRRPAARATTSTTPATCIDLAKQLGEEDYRAARSAGQTVTSWEGAEESVAKVLTHQVFTKEVWMAAIEGTDFPPARRRLGHRPARAARGRRAPLARGGARHRPARRLGRPDRRRAVRPAGELRALQHRRATCSPTPRTAASWSAACCGTPGSRRRRRRPDQLAARRVSGRGGRMTRTTYYTATTLDGFIADDRGLARLAVRPGPGRGRPAQLRASSSPGIGALVMGSHDVRVDPGPQPSARAKAGPTTSRPG